MNYNQIIQKIEWQYVSDECVQVMIPYENTITILNKDGILFHHKPDSNLYINKYLKDERRKKFPYSNIPRHISKVNLFKKMNYTNQLLNFEESYIKISDGIISENFAVKEKQEALMICNIITPEEYTKFMTYEELINYLYEQNENEQIYHMYLNGGIIDEEILPTEKEIYEHLKMELAERIPKIMYRNFGVIINGDEYIENTNLSIVDFNLKLHKGLILIVRIKDKDITIKAIEITFINLDKYKIKVYDFPVTKYCLEQLKYATKIYDTKEPKIPIRINPIVTKQDVKTAKQMVKTLKTISK